MNQKVFDEAKKIISARRIQAKAENERRYQEINEKIPEIAEINYQLAQTSYRILKGENIENLKRQNLQAQKYCSQLLISHNYPADYLNIHYTCPKCQDTGYLKTGYCTCLEKLIASIGAEQMNRSAQLKLCSFEQFSLDYYLDEDGRNYAIMKKILQKCKSYAANFQAHSRSMLFFGDPGTGKTHLSLSIVTEVLKQGYEVIYDSVGNLLSKVEHEHFSYEKPDEDTLQTLLNAEFLVLDDLGTEFQSSFNMSVIYTLINTRINRKLPTIISTNLSSKDLTLQYEDRITSRLFLVYDINEFVGTDIRALKKKKGQQSGC